jgi:hypothetical protein
MKLEGRRRHRVQVRGRLLDPQQGAVAVRSNPEVAMAMAMAGAIGPHLYNAYWTTRKLFGSVRRGRSARFHVGST